MMVTSPTPAEAPCVMLTGVPRSGTTLCCELLNQLPDVRALDEPLPMLELIRKAQLDEDTMDIDRLCRDVALFVGEQRRSIVDRGAAVSKHVQGRVIGSRRVEDVRDNTGTRRNLVKLGMIHVGRPETADFTLVIKEPVVFTALLTSLRERFPIVAIVRNPLAVLGSWESMPWRTLRMGQLGIPAAMAPAIYRRLANLDDALERRIEMLMWYFEQYAAMLSHDRVIRYEDLISSAGSVLSTIAPSASRLKAPLWGRNTSAVYDRAHLRRVGRRLLERDDAPWRIYYPNDVEELLESFAE
jgi:hypothetical protein